MFPEEDSRGFENRASEPEPDCRPEPDGRPCRRALSLIAVKNRKMNPMSIDFKESTASKYFFSGTRLWEPA